MNYYLLENLTSKSSKLTLKHPSTLKSSIPGFSSKEGFREWCKDPATKHVFFSAVEGVNPHERVRSANPPFKMHGFVVDYDGEELVNKPLPEIIAAVGTDKSQDFGGRF